MRPLEGVVVLDFSTLLPGPLASLLLVEAGAEVIKIERPGIGDEMRHYPPHIGNQSALFAMLNRGKHSLALDLKSAKDRARLEPYLNRADIVIEQFRPGVMARMELDYDTLSKRFPQLIYCSITGFGQTGPKAQVAGHDLNYIAETGLLALSMGPSHAPVVPPALIADIAGGAYPAMMNILLAMESRRRNGHGTHLDISMTDNMFPLAWWALGQHAATGHAPKNGSELLVGGTARYRLYPTSDGHILAAAPIEQRFWDRFCDAIGLAPELRNDQTTHRQTLDAVTAIIASKPSHDWRAIFETADCCCTLVTTLDQALKDPHFESRNFGTHRIEVPGEAQFPALPVPISPQFRNLSQTIQSAPDLDAETETETG